MGSVSRHLPQGRKSEVTLLDDGSLVRKTYNDNGDPMGKYLREVGFYAHYGASELIPDLVEPLADERAIVLTRAPGIRCADLQPDPGFRRRLSADYADKVADLLSVRADVGNVKPRYYGNVGASAYRDGVMSILDGYRPSTRQGQGKDIVGRLRASASQVTVTDEILIKLDWNASNVFVDGGAVSQFIDFEQAFIGTREILTGILLHNPFWCARTVFAVLRRRGVFTASIDDVVPYVDFGLAAVIADAFERDGRPWSEHRLESAYRRHVVDRLAELSSATL